MRRWLILRLEAPLLSFGTVAIDKVGPTDDFPAASMLTGLLSNALGWERREGARLDALQARLVFAARRDREPYAGTFTDIQNALLEQSDRGWTTRGRPEGRAGGSYAGAHRRWRDYHPDALVQVALTLAEPEADPTLDDLAAALERPARPLFLGRKPCLPAAPIHAGFLHAETAYAALEHLPAVALGAQSSLRAQWPDGEGPGHPPAAERTRRVTGRRNWVSGLHGGEEIVIEGHITPRADVAAELAADVAGDVAGEGP